MSVLLAYLLSTSGQLADFRELSTVFILSDLQSIRVTGLTESLAIISAHTRNSSHFPPFHVLIPFYSLVYY